MAVFETVLWLSQTVAHSGRLKIYDFKSYRLAKQTIEIRLPPFCVSPPAHISPLFDSYTSWQLSNASWHAYIVS
jgi:hypothetical protein